MFAFFVGALKARKFWRNPYNHFILEQRNFTHLDKNTKFYMAKNSTFTVNSITSISELLPIGCTYETAYKEVNKIIFVTTTAYQPYFKIRYSSFLLDFYLPFNFLLYKINNKTSYYACEYHGQAYHLPHILIST